ncbi:phosducin-like protein isoform X2 [Centruroides sculpturatus]|uniref:phosducin-like protein isoform X1 n=1 Tax=Centruroides sculpturatus TaxID=218467 RepID=UPI000C6E6F09|nr:phosducin-like protein isoform X1 [Centruroides sculpturatus]XP_023227437.1 phosducin-like protein isoform X2 [Centruroides sculpturatus]
MATLDDKLLGEKLHYYCSSDEEIDDDEDSNNDDDETTLIRTAKFNSSDYNEWEGSSTNTGPKGVIKDWQRYKQLENEKRDEQEREKLELFKKLSLTCRSNLDDEQAKQKEEEIEKDLQELMNDEFLKEYMQKRMEEMMKSVQNKTKFNALYNLKNGQEYLEAIEKEKPTVTIVIHIYTADIPGCEAMNGCLQCLAQEYPSVKFCRLEASSAGMSKHFENYGVPALLVYKGGQLIGNFVRLTDEFGDDFYAGDVENFLLEHGMLPDQSLVPVIVKRDSKQNEKTDSDFELE